MHLESLSMSKTFGPATRMAPNIWNALRMQWEFLECTSNIHAGMYKEFSFRRYATALIPTTCMRFATEWRVSDNRRCPRLVCVHGYTVIFLMAHGWRCLQTHTHTHTHTHACNAHRHTLKCNKSSKVQFNKNTVANNIIRHCHYAWCVFFLFSLKCLSCIRLFAIHYVCPSAVFTTLL